MLNQMINVRRYCARRHSLYPGALVAAPCSIIQSERIISGDCFQSKGRVILFSLAHDRAAPIESSAHRQSKIVDVNCGYQCSAAFYLRRKSGRNE